MRAAFSRRRAASAATDIAQWNGTSWSALGSGISGLGGDGNGPYVNALTVLTNNGSGVFGYNNTYGVGLNPYSVVTADVNGDGKLDLISANEGEHTDGADQ